MASNTWPLLRQAIAAVIGVAALNVTAQTLPAPPVSPAPVTNYEYDAQGNPTRVIQAPGVAGFNFNTSTSYDRLERAKDSTDARSGITRFDYNGREDLTGVTDPRNLVTTYPRNGLGDVTSLASPDTGTATHTFDAQGNLKTRTDSRGVLATYSYDSLNRLTSVVYSKAGSTSRTYSWTYDQATTGFTNGIGRLTTTTYPDGNRKYAYDQQGRVTTATQVTSARTGANSSARTHVVSYAYDSAGNVTSLTYPSGRVLNLSYTDGQLSAMSLKANATAAAVSLISGVQWEPFGAARSWLWQMNTGTQLHERIHDAYGRLVRYRLGAVIRDITYDAADRITAYTHYDAATAAANSALNQSFGYDELGRLTTITTATTSWTIGYDANGNRTSVTQGATSRTYTTPATSNRLTALTNPAVAFTHDSAGNTLTGSTTAVAYTSTYNLEGRLATNVVGTTTSTYSHDTSGQRTRKYASTNANTTVIFVYDQQGQLLGEYSNTGAALREYVWLGNEPIAVFTPNGTNPPNIFYIHNDHIQTPRAVQNKAGQLRWRWLAEPFGTTAAENNPQSLGAFTFNLRHPGQYADTETGLFYNWHRDYDAGTGRYVQSDPIGLQGGINTYAYTENNPISFTDPRGLVKWSGWAFNVATTAPFGASVYHVTLTSECKCGKQYTIKVVAVGPAAGLGVKLAATVSEVTFDDLDTCADPGSFNGRFTAGGGAVTGGAIPLPGPHARVGLGLPGVGIGAGYLQLGRNFTTGFFPPSFVAGRDMSVTGAVGSSTVMSVEEKPCDCK
jgi:RHS repeat-associated protein